MGKGFSLTNAVSTKKYKIEYIFGNININIFFYLLQLMIYNSRDNFKMMSWQFNCNLNIDMTVMRRCTVFVLGRCQQQQISFGVLSSVEQQRVKPECVAAVSVAGKPKS